MATLSFTIPDAVVARVLDAAAAKYDYLDPETGLPRIPGQTKTQFMREVIKRFIKEIVKAHESQNASESARLQAIAAVESEIQIT